MEKAKPTNATLSPLEEGEGTVDQVHKINPVQPTSKIQQGVRGSTASLGNLTR